VLPVALVLLVHAATLEERLDHRGSVGLLLAVTGMNKVANSTFEIGWRGGFEVGGTLNLGTRSNELVLVGRVAFGGVHVGSGLAGTDVCDPMKNPNPPPLQYCVPDDHRLHQLDTLIYSGYRGYFGDRWKTFVEFDLALSLTPFLTAGPRVGVGVQYEVGSLFGVYAQLGGNLGFGEVLQFRTELLLGVQLRSYLLE
jgi:hypothetical protein